MKEYTSDWFALPPIEEPNGFSVTTRFAYINVLQEMITFLTYPHIPLPTDLSFLVERRDGHVRVVIHAERSDANEDQADQG